MESGVRILNRKKMKRFLQSLRGRTTEELEERKSALDARDAADDEFVTIKDNVTSQIYPRQPHKSRHTTFSQRSTHARPAIIEESESERPPKYVPASRYALPMKPPPFFPSKDSKNAARIPTLSRLRTHPRETFEFDPGLIAATEKVLLLSNQIFLVGNCADSSK
jgi:hypothetical protein